MKKALIGALASASLMLTSTPSLSITIGLTGDVAADWDNGNITNATTLASSYGAGSSATRIDAATFNALSVSDLLATYDLLVMGWFGDASYNFDWTTRLLPYISAGGAVIFEDPDNLADLAASGLTFNDDVGGGVYSGVYGPNDFTSSHFAFTTSGSWECFYTSSTPGSCLAARSRFGAGGIIVSGPDEFWHDITVENDAFLRAEADWVLGAASVPEPASLALLALGIAGIGFGIRRRT